MILNYEIKQHNFDQTCANSQGLIKSSERLFRPDFETSRQLIAPAQLNRTIVGVQTACHLKSTFDELFGKAHDVRRVVFKQVCWFEKGW